MSAQPDSAPGMKAAQIPKVDDKASKTPNGYITQPAGQQKRIVVVGLGMVGIAFMYGNSESSRSHRENHCTSLELQEAVANI